MADTANSPNWNKAQTVFLENGNKPLKLSELETEFRKRNWPISEKNAREVLRATLNSKPSIFVYNREDCTYRIKIDRPETRGGVHEIRS
ncbi:MAG TPA: hypothetical protein VMT62_05870 [Syntrophorhabdaceae bacterium]|nr:hypothetical protein [Syntrophorhabdaceae bacterium]